MRSYAMVFPGQGSQSVGMLADIAAKFPQVQQRFAEASEILGFDLWQLTQEGTAEQLSETTVTQPLMLTADIAIWDIWKTQVEVMPTVVAGHSLGEYSALVAAGGVTFDGALKAVVARANAMATAVPAGEGGMLAVIGLDVEQLESICDSISKEHSLVVGCVNYNAPGQTVIGGQRSALALVESAAKEAGAKRVLPVAMSVPSHSPLMRPAAPSLEKRLQEIEIQVPQQTALINNARLAIETESEQIKQALVEQIYKPVNWIKVVEKMAGMKVSHLIECGPGKVLTGLNKRIDKSLSLHTLGKVEGLEAAKADILQA